MECYNVTVTRARRNWKVPGRQHVAATGGRIATFHYIQNCLKSRSA